MTYQETIKYLESFVNYEKVREWPYKESLKLERLRDFLAILDNPQAELRCIHIAGSKGKGSTCAFIAYILRGAGYKVGLYTSPHLSDFRERIRILEVTRHTPHGTRKDFEGMISKKELIDLVERLGPAIARYNRISKYGRLSFFEVYTALAFTYFREKKTDFLVLETGLGGRLDATNVVNALVCVITPISYEHTDKLGNTLREIATEKALIIKEKAPSIVITAAQEKEVIEVLRRRCEKTKSSLFEIQKDIFYEKTKKGFNVKGLFDNYFDLRKQLLGEHQLINASVAIGAVEALRVFGIPVGVDFVKAGIYNTLWPGRCEVVSKNPVIILDGAQNVASMCVLKRTVKEEFRYRRLILILGVSNDKDIKGICGELSDFADEIILTRAKNPRATHVAIIEEIIKAQGARLKARVITTKNVKEAVRIAERTAKEEDLILVTGSLFVVGEARELCKGRKNVTYAKHRFNRYYCGDCNVDR